MTDRETHVDDERGLFIPEDLREFDAQIVFRTPRSTIQHFGSRPLEAYYGMIRADQFGDPDEMRDAKNPDLAPERVKIKPQGADPVTLTVDVDPQIRADGGSEPPASPSVIKWGGDDTPNAILSGLTSLAERFGSSTGPSETRDAEESKCGSRRPAVSEREVCRFCGSFVDEHTSCPALPNGGCRA